LNAEGVLADRAHVAFAPASPEVDVQLVPPITFSPRTRILVRDCRLRALHGIDQDFRRRVQSQRQLFRPRPQKSHAWCAYPTEQLRTASSIQKSMLRPAPFWSCPVIWVSLFHLIIRSRWSAFHLPALAIASARSASRGGFREGARRLTPFGEDRSRKSGILPAARRCRSPCQDVSLNTTWTQ
jgi:hypothetical protein